MRDTPMRKQLTAAGFFGLLFLTSALNASPLTPGNLSVVRVGNGTDPLVNTGNVFFLDEYTKTGTFVQSIAITGTGAAGLQLSGTATSEGALSLAGNGQSLVFAGYNPGATGFTGTGSLSSRTAAQAPRAFGSVDLNGTYAFGSTFAGNYSGGNVRGASSNGTGDTWGTGSNTGTVLVNAANPTGLVIQNAVTNTRVTNVVDGNLYFSTGSGSSRGILGFTGTPTSATAATSIISTGGSGDAYDFAFSPGPLQAGSYAYIADASSGVQRWDFNGTTWSNSRTFTATGNGLTGLAVDFTTNTIFATGPSAIWTAIDAGSGGAMTSLVSAPSGTAFRGIEVMPVPEPQAFVLTGIAAIPAVAFGVRRNILKANR